MASPTEDQFDKCSTSSSLEIVDALTEAAEDNREDLEDKEGSPAESVLSCPDLVMVDKMEDFLDPMVTSQYAQVVFDDIEDVHPCSSDLACHYSLTPGLVAGHGDRVGLYRLPFLQPHESCTYIWAGVGEGTTHTVTFPAKSLPQHEDFYQFQYLRGDNSVAGASIPFQLRLDPGERRRQEDQQELENKYTSLLQHSEQIGRELETRNQSFVVLERQHRSIQEEVARRQQEEEDMATLVANRSELRQTLKATEETLARTEGVLEVTTTRLKEAEELVVVKAGEVARLEVRLSEMGEEREERDKLAVMLEQEQAAREGLLQEKARLLERLEDSEAMVAAAARSKDLAVAEIRSQVAQQDALRRDLAGVREELGRAEADLVEVKQEMEVKETILTSLAARLETKEREVDQRMREVEVVREEVKGVQENVQAAGTQEITDACLEDADRRAATLEREKRELEGRVVQLEEEVGELRARLEAGAQHYRRLAAAKEKLERQQGEQGRVAALEEQVRQLREELRVSRAAQELQLCGISEQVSRATSLAPSSPASPSITSFTSLSTEGNMDSLRIGAALQEPAPHQPSLFQPFPAPQPPASPSLPPPLLPEAAGAAAEVPELRPRVPAPYSSSSLEEEQVEGEEEEGVKCPWCDVMFPAGSTTLEAHVETHLSQVLECPVCVKMFEKDHQAEFEEHVQGHFPGQGTVDISIRGWDLGID